LVKKFREATHPPSIAGKQGLLEMYNVFIVPYLT
jgi:hypothetical protein